MSHGITTGPGALFLADLSPVAGPEQGGSRPVLVVSAPGHLSITAGRLLTICPVTSRDRGVVNHIAITPASSHRLTRASWVMTEQSRTISSRRIARPLGTIGADDLDAVLAAVHRFVARPGVAY